MLILPEHLCSVSVVRFVYFGLFYFSVFDTQYESTEVSGTLFDFQLFQWTLFLVYIICSNIGCRNCQSAVTRDAPIHRLNINIGQYATVDWH